MRKGQIRRVNLSLHLTPEQSHADLRAMQQLQKWHQSVNQSASVDDSNMEIRAFHRDVYLAGLQLFLMDPALCHHVAESLGRENLTLETLLSELQPELKPDAPSAQLEELQKIRDEVAALRPLMEQHKLALQQLRLAAKNVSAPAPERDNIEVSKVDAPVEKMQKIRQKGIF
ncbi:hypothetical protein VPX56_02015 [Enterobacter wuhouensis]|uniref:Uncharacterized protein n=1 Tax=Enterobacter wuhouensis TaxID=2529381 RepID=A0ABZ1DH25_9ENTR|nr:hypothetical protein [Enterobacter wuhouensis]MCV2534241.1 hypothetical protein [Enterobacter wuhouensis]WRW31926.1 hypothetical protein VPX56_02015 [Enterobacter wuhouensis]